LGAAADIERRRAAAARIFEERFGRAPELIATAPGRVNLIGEHLDYNEGLVLPCAIDRGVAVACGRRDDATVLVHSTEFGDASSLSLHGAIERDHQHPWADYARGTIAVLTDGGYSGPGLDIAIGGDLPIGAGLSSSAAVEVAVLGAVAAAWDVELPSRELALLAQRAENEFVGVQCGIMDQFAAALGLEGYALLIDCRTLECQFAPLRLEEQGVALVVVDSGVPRRLDQSEYNVRREECAEAFTLVSRVIERPVQALRDVSIDELDGVTGQLPPRLFRRVRHVVTELARVHHAVDALRSDDFESFGRLMNDSHAGLRDDFEVSRNELDRLVFLAQSRPEVLGARLTGAGFGGCTVNLVRADAVEVFEDAVVCRYANETGLPARMFPCKPSGGLHVSRSVAHGS
jgi:galactokinase